MCLMESLLNFTSLVTTSVKQKHVGLPGNRMDLRYWNVSHHTDIRFLPEFYLPCCSSQRRNYYFRYCRLEFTDYQEIQDFSPLQCCHRKLSLGLVITIEMTKDYSVTASELLDHLWLWSTREHTTLLDQGLYKKMHFTRKFLTNARIFFSGNTFA